MIMTTENEDLRTKISMRATYEVKNEQFLSLNLEVALGKLFL